MENTVIVGLGAISSHHIEPILEMGKLYGVCDIDERKVAENVKKYSCVGYYDFEDVINDENVDCVHILTPHYLHFSMAKMASEKGKTVVLEKPAVMNMNEFEELLGIFKKNRTKNLIVLQNRYNPCIVYLKENMKNLKYELGEYLGSKGVLTWFREDNYYLDSPWRGRYETEGGGFLINQAPHIIDLILYFGGEIESFEGNAHLRYLKNTIEVEDTCEAFFQFKNSTRSVFYGTNGYVTNAPFDMEFAFEKGAIRYVYGKLLKVTPNSMEILCADSEAKGAKGYWGNSHKTILESFYGNNKCPTLEDYKEICMVLEQLINTRRRNTI